jgi:hypothetical protein
MSAPKSVPSARLAELLVSAASHVSAPPAGGLVPAGIPVRDGRLHLGRLRGLLDGDGRLAVVAGFATGAWIGPPATSPPDLGRLTYRTDTSVDRRGRVLVDFRVCRWLAVTDTHAFEVVVVPADPGGLLIVPAEGFARRWEVIAR